jgi:hypothetical protein
VGNLADDQEEVVRIAGLLRGTESAAQCVSVRILRFLVCISDTNEMILVRFEQREHHGGCG